MRAAGLLLVCDGKVLLQLRSEHVDHPHTWSIPAGTCDRGETAETTAIRETWEEIDGLPSGIIVPTGQTWTHGAFTSVHATLDAPRPPQVSPRTIESTEARWVPLDEVAHLPNRHPAFHASWPEMLDAIRDDDAPPATSEPLPQVEAWRIFWVRNGQLFAPMFGGLDVPIGQGDVAVCAWEDHTPPAPGCYCGWRGAVTPGAVRDAFQTLAHEPDHNVPCTTRYLADSPRRPEDWTWPRPALAQVTLIDAVPCDSPFNRDPLLRARADAHFARKGQSVIEEGDGMYRARSIRIERVWVLDDLDGSQRYAHRRDVLDLERGLGVLVTQRPGNPMTEFDKIAKETA